MLKVFLTSLNYECLILMRRSKEWVYPIGFFLIVMCLFPLCLSPDPVFLKKYVCGFVWVAALLSNLLAIQTIYQNDLATGYLEQLLLSPHPLSLLISSKLLAHWMTSSLSIILLTPLLGLFFQLDWYTISLLSISLLLGTPIITLIGTFSISLTLGLGQQGLMLGIMMLPLLIPVVVFASNLLVRAELHLPISGTIALLSALLIFSILLMPLVIGSALRLSFDE